MEASTHQTRRRGGGGGEGTTGGTFLKRVRVKAYVLAVNWRECGLVAAVEQPNGEGFYLYENILCDADSVYRTKKMQPHWPCSQKYPLIRYQNTSHNYRYLFRGYVLMLAGGCLASFASGWFVKFVKGSK